MRDVELKTDPNFALFVLNIGPIFVGFCFFVDLVRLAAEEN